MNNIFLIGSPCTGKTTTSNNLAQNYNLNVIHMDNLVKETFYPLCDLLLDIDDLHSKKSIAERINNIPFISNFRQESINDINTIVLYLKEHNISREQFIQNFDKYPDLTQLLPKEFNSGFFSKLRNRKKIEKLFEINDKIDSELLNFNLKILSNYMSRQEILELLNDQELTIKNTEKVKFYLNKILNANTNGLININQISESLGADIAKLRELKIDEIDITDKFSMLISCIDIEHSIDRKGELTDHDKELHDICFKIKEFLLIDLINNSCKDSAMIDLGGGMTYYEGYGNFSHQYNFLKNELKNLLKSDLVIHILPHQDIEKSKTILIERAKERKGSVSYIKQINEHINSKCNDLYADVKVYQSENINKQFERILTNLEHFIDDSPNYITELDEKIKKYKEQTIKEEPVQSYDDFQH